MTLGYEKSLLGVTAKTELVRYDTFSVEENAEERAARSWGRRARIAI